MTTIAYQYAQNQIAVDSRLTRGNMIVSDNSEKHRVINGQVWFFKGKCSDENLLVAWGGNGSVPECSAIVAKDGKAFWVVAGDAGLEWTELTFNEAGGSGQEFALAAMDFGKTAKEAVEYAATRDSATGGVVRVFDVANMRFID